MPLAVFKTIREVTSEDKIHCAASLLQREPAKKWKTGETGEKSAYVVIEMDAEYSIKGIDIGNECSAFVEVLVGGPTCARENFKEILITCSFMTPIESKTTTNTNRVRCFNREALVEEVAAEKWKLLKVICSQPFNRNIKYGLSFIKVHVEEPLKAKKTIESNGNTSMKLGNITCGSFKLREDSPDSESESKAALFNRWKVARNKDVPGTTSTIPKTPTQATLRKPQDSSSLRKTPSSSNAPSAPAVINSPEEKDSTKKEKLPDRNRNSLVFNDDDDDSGMQDRRKRKLEKLEKIIMADQERVTKEADRAKHHKKPDSHKDINRSVEKKPKLEEPKRDSKVQSPKKISANSRKPSTPSTCGQRRPSSSPCVNENAKKPKMDKTVAYLPFNQLLRGVVLVISGIQNPDRADLRNKALALGAKYKGDWDSSSTHLICAFKNTPKYNQVKGIGKIIKRSWIEDCHSQKKRLPWRRYALETSEQNKPESEDEIFDESLKPSVSKPSTSQRISVDENDDDDVVELYDKNEESHSQFISSGSDTEDEIQKVLATTSPKIKKKATEEPDIFEVSTEEEDYVSKRAINNSSQGQAFFKNLKMFVSDKLSATEKIKVERCIETYCGTLTTSIGKADYVIANEAVNGEAFKGVTVKPLWILECNDEECLLPTKRYLVT